MKYSRSQIIDFTILCLRWYLAFYMFSYGWGKITGGQFGVHDSHILEKPMKDIDRFYIAWHLFGQSAIFYVTAGILEVAGAILLIINRTALLGALFLLPVLGQILLVDLAFTTNQFGSALVIRLLGMLLADLTIIVYYRKIIIKIWHLLYRQAVTPRYKYWVYILIPLIGFATDFLMAVALYPLRLIVDLIISK